jgi:hypothetical protein
MYMVNEQLEDQSHSVSAFSQLHHMLPKIMKSFVCTKKAIYTTKRGEFTNKFRCWLHFDTVYKNSVK